MVANLIAVRTIAFTAAVTAAGMLYAPLSAGAQDAAPKFSKGEVLYSAGGCANCHTDVKNKGPESAGGRGLKTPFGTFYSPNITPDPRNGIGRWSEADFIGAMRTGKAPDGSHYFPVFPFTSFTLMTDEDLKALFAHLKTLKPVARANKPHDVPFPFNVRLSQMGWKMLFFEKGPFRPDASKSPEWNRGAYLARAVAHCGECHTPRNVLGGLDRDRWFGGSKDGAEGESVPNITPGGAVGKWTDEQVANYLAIGETPDGDFAGSLMAEVIEKGTGRLSPADRKAIVAYMRSLKPIRREGAK
jgi:mono/diheme cytochrome c family protein